MSSKIYTKTGDQGETGLFGGPRVAKDNTRIAAYGTVDELNACLGLVRTEQLSPALEQLLIEIQNDLFALGAQLATPDPAAHGTDLIQDTDIRRLELAIDTHEQSLEPLKHFILPAGVRTAALLHVARAVCRRAERQVVTLLRSQTTSTSNELRYLNRLSDLLFVLARFANHLVGYVDAKWEKPPANKPSSE